MPAKTVEALRALGVYNTFGVAHMANAGRRVFVVFYGADHRRGGHGALSRVHATDHKTDPHGAWYDNGSKTFLGPRDESLPLARAWATEKYGITEWATCPTDRNALVPAEARRRALALVKEETK